MTLRRRRLLPALFLSPPLAALPALAQQLGAISI